MNQKTISLELYLKGLEREARNDANFTSSSITSMAEDEEIREVGRAKLKIVKEIRKFL